jgi:Cof subfamily protein (haloacid dehalogenase superfamily)
MDLDGTLLTSDSTISAANQEALQSVRAQGYVRVAVTGRSLYSADHVLTEVAPLDYLAVSSGAATFDWRTRELLLSHEISSHDTERGIEILLSLGMDFMVHDPVPDNHCFAYCKCDSVPNPDFEKRKQRYQRYARALDESGSISGPATQFLVVSPPHNEAGELHEHLVRLFDGFTVVRTTSPLDPNSTWFEIFPSGVSKGGAAEWIRDQYGLARERCLAIGNDYNDLSLLEWCGHSFVVDNAPAALKNRFATVPSNDEDGVSRAVERWLDTLESQ